MDRCLRVALVWICWSLLALSTHAEGVPPTETDRLRGEIAELKALVSQLSQRVQSLETQLAHRRPEVQLRLATHFEPVGSSEVPVDLPASRMAVPSNIERGMQMEAIEHSWKWDRVRDPWSHGPGGR